HIQGARSPAACFRAAINGPIRRGAMRQGKFAPVTAALLARKGEARPWGYDGTEGTPAPDAGFYSPRAVAARSPHEEHSNDASPPPVAIAFSQTGDGMRRLTLRVS